MASRSSRRRRLRFEAVDKKEFPDGRCQVQVRLGWPGGEHFLGEGEGTCTTQGLLRACAKATLLALEGAVEGRLTVSLSGVKAFRAFDAWIIVCAVRARSEDRSYSLTGAQASEKKDDLRATVRSVLDAVNRVSERYAEPAHVPHRQETPAD